MNNFPSQDSKALNRDAHRQSDVDAERLSIHHTLGIGATQAAAGNHNHDADYSGISHDHDVDYAALVHNHYDEYSISGINSSDLVTAWPSGVTHFSAGNAPDGGLGYPMGAISSVLTFNTPARAIQFNFIKTQATSNDTPDIYYRLIKVGTNDTWDPVWKSLVKTGHTHSPNDPVEVFCTANATINSTTDTDIPGLTTVVAVGATTEKYEVSLYADVATDTVGSAVLFLRLVIDGTVYTASSGDELIYSGKAAGDRLTLHYKWHNITGLSVGNHTFKIQGDSNGATATYFVRTPRSKMVVKKVSPIG